jgi:hypothetical protein
VATRLYSEAELDQLRRFPDAIPADQLIRFFTLMPGDVAFVNGHRGESSRLGVAVQLCTLPWLGFVPDDVVTAPVAAVQRLGRLLSILSPRFAITAPGSRHALTIFVRSRRFWAGASELGLSSKSWISFCWRGRWSTTRRACFSSWRVSSCAAPG